MEAAAVIQRRLFDYSDQLRDWAADVGGLMVKRTAKIDYDTWLRVGEGISRQTRKLLKSKAVGAEYSRLQQSQIDLITSLPRQAAQDVQEWVKDGLSKGQRFDEIAKRIKKDLGAKSDSRAVLIARTETARSRSNFTQARARDVGSTHYIWHTVGDGSVRSMHAKLDGTIQRWDDPPVCEHGRGGTPVKGNPGSVWNCFTGDTLVRLDRDVRKIIRAPFNGRVVSIRTSASDVTVTPNHPMLTQRGWVPACEVDKGDYLLQPFGDAVEAVESDENHVIARFDEVFDAVSGEVKRIPVEFNFYGDVPDGDVDVALTEGRLTFDVVSERLKHGRDFDLARPDRVVAGIVGDALHVGLSGGSREGATLVVRGPRHSEIHGGGRIPDDDVCLFKALPNGEAIYSKRCGERELAFPRLVTADDLSVVEFLPVVGGVALPLSGVDAKRSKFEGDDVGGVTDCLGGVLNGGPALYKGFRVLEKVSSDFLGHVYTLETSKGWYCVTHSNFIAKNCRCWAEPLFPKSKHDK